MYAARGKVGGAHHASGWWLGVSIEEATVGDGCTHGARQAASSSLFAEIRFVDDATFNNQLL